MPGQRSEAAGPRPSGRRLGAMLRLRCPRCLEGRVFAGLVRMHDTCARCRLRFWREPGYFIGAMYFSYGMGVIAAAPVCIVLYLAGYDSLWVALAALVQLCCFAPWLWRYSRILWLHLDQVFDPR